MEKPTTKVPVAKWRVAAVFADCPHCGEAVLASNGSFLLTHEQASNGLGAGAEIQCPCGQWFKMPSVMGRL